MITRRLLAVPDDTAGVQPSAGAWDGSTRGRHAAAVAGLKIILVSAGRGRHRSPYAANAHAHWRPAIPQIATVTIMRVIDSNTTATSAPPRTKITARWVERNRTQR